MQRTHPRLWDYETIEHLKPRVEGGSNHMSNLALAHKLCNHKRGTQKREPLIRPLAREPRRKRLIAQLPKFEPTHRGSLLDSAAVLRCTICHAKRGECDCWTSCPCGWNYRKGTPCRNPECTERTGDEQCR